MNRILVPESLGEEIRQLLQTCRHAHKCPRSCGSIVGSTPSGTQLLGEGSSLTLGPKVGCSCADGAAWAKAQRWENPRRVRFGWSKENGKGNSGK